MNKKSRREHLEQVAKESRTMVFYEAPHKLPNTLQDMLAAWGDRRIAIVRELTKVHEEVIRTTLSEAAARYAEGGARGEIVLVVEGAAPETSDSYTPEQAIALAQTYMEEGSSPSDAAKQAARITGVKKGTIYRGLIEGEKEGF